MAIPASIERTCTILLRLLRLSPRWTRSDTNSRKLPRSQWSSCGESLKGECGTDKNPGMSQAGKENLNKGAARPSSALSTQEEEVNFGVYSQCVGPISWTLYPDGCYRTCASSMRNSHERHRSIILPEVDQTCDDSAGQYEQRCRHGE